MAVDVGKGFLAAAENAGRGIFFHNDAVLVEGEDRFAAFRKLQCLAVLYGKDNAADLIDLADDGHHRMTSL